MVPPAKVCTSFWWPAVTDAGVRALLWIFTSSMSPLNMFTANVPLMTAGWL
ncbi:hypothetical protein SGLAM104S_08297 [Streptomyces glaucescens]